MLNRLVFPATSETALVNPMRPYIKNLTYIDIKGVWNYDRHTHDDFSEIMFIEEGSAMYTLDNKVYNLSAGDIVIINKGVVHSQSSVPTSALKLWCCAFKNASFFGLDDEKLIKDNMHPIFNVGEYHDYLANRLSALYTERVCERLHSHEICQSIMSDIFFHFSRIVKNSGEKTIYNPHNSIATRVKAYIDDNFTSKINLDILSNIFDVTTYHINHEMKREMGISPIDYLISRRIGEAQRLLISTNKTAQQIAHDVGYDNVHHFFNLFKKRIGSSPIAFRAKHSENKSLM